MRSRFYWSTDGRCYEVVYDDKGKTLAVYRERECWPVYVITNASRSQFERLVKQIRESLKVGRGPDTDTFFKYL